MGPGSTNLLPSVPYSWIPRPHSCWQAVCSDCPRLLPRRLQKGKKAKVSSSSLVIPLPAQPSWPLFCRGRHSSCLEQESALASPKGASRILNGLDYSSISSLLALECECRCKTALVVNSPLPSWVLRQLDQAGFGLTVYKE